MSLVHQFGEQCCRRVVALAGIRGDGPQNCGCRGDRDPAALLQDSDGAVGPFDDELLDALFRGGRQIVLGTFGPYPWG